MTTRFRPVIHSPARALTSSSVMPGMKSLCRSYSYWMPGRRLAVEEGPGELLGVGLGVLGLFFGQGPLEVAQGRRLAALDLGRREPEAGHPLPFRVDRPEAAGDAAVADEGRDDEDVLGADEPPLARDGAEEGRVGLLGDLREPVVERVVEEPLDEHAAVGPDQALVGRGELVVDGDDARGGLLVRGDGEERPVVVGDGIGRARHGGGRHRDGPEVLLDEGLDLGPVEIPDGDDGHEIGAVPGPVVALQGVVGEALDDLLLAVGEALGVAGALEEDGELLVPDARLGALAQAPLLDDDAPLLVDGLGLEGQVVGPVLHDQERVPEDGLGIRRDLEHVDRLVEAGEGVEVGTEAHADRLHEFDELLLREVGRAVECQVLDDVGQPALVLVLEDGPGVDDKAQLGPVLRLAVLADPVPEPVGELADRDPGIDRDLLVEGVLGGRDGGLGGLRPPGPGPGQGAAGRRGRPRGPGESKRRKGGFCAGFSSPLS